MPDLNQRINSKALSRVYGGISRVVSTPAKISYSGKNFLNELIAIWDTGANLTVISERIAAEFGLVPVGAEEVSTANGKTTVNVYLLDVILPMGVVFPSMKVIDAKMECDMLIGMDIMTQGDFAITNHNGKTVMTYRKPSRETINWVEDARNASAFTKAKTLGKKSICTCGSNKKYKDCCGKPRYRPTN